MKDSYKSRWVGANVEIDSLASCKFWKLELQVFYFIYGRGFAIYIVVRIFSRSMREDVCGLKHFYDQQSMNKRGIEY